MVGLNSNSVEHVDVEIDTLAVLCGVARLEQLYE
jgi:hypothetical protein